jgi:hypothetical protein
MAWSCLSFGKHKGKSLPQVLFTDPDWFFWAYEEPAFNKSITLRTEAANIYKKASSIRIPQSGSEPLVVEYQFQPGDCTSIGFVLVEESRPSHQGSTRTFRSDHIDMRYPRLQKGYDKLGYAIFLRCIKRELFGNESARMTKERCEKFFSGDSNFVF